MKSFTPLKSLTLAAVAALCWLPSPADAEALRFYDPGTGQVLLVNSTNPLPVTGGYAAGITNAAPNGMAVLGLSPANTLLALLVDSLGVLKVVPQATENHIGQIGGTLLPSSVTFTRPADTTAYAALDVISNSTSAPSLLSFANILRVVNGSGYITKAELSTTNTSWTGRVRLMLYATSAPAPVGDNAQFPALSANDAVRIGYIDFPPPLAFGSGSDEVISLVPDVRLAVVGGATTTIFGIPISLDAQTNTSASSFTFKLTLDSN